MRISEFLRLPEYEDEFNVNGLFIGDDFLMDQNIINQKQTKNKVGESITYYRVIRKTHKCIEYIPIYDYLEKDIKEEL